MPRRKKHRKQVRFRNVAGDAHFLTFSCYHRLPLLTNDRIRQWLIDAIAAARIGLVFDLWAWVIMPEHVHLLLFPRLRPYDMSTIVSQIKTPVGTKAIRYIERNAPSYLDKLTVVNKNRTYRHFWQPGPGYDENIDDPVAIRRVIKYIHQNPVRRGLVEKAEDWVWSSARDWAGLESPLIKVDRTIPRIYIIGE